MKVNVFIVVNAKSPRVREESFLSVALPEGKGSMANSPTRGARMQPVIIIWTAMNALKAAVVLRPT